MLAAAGATLTAGSLSAALESGPDPAFSARIRQSGASAQSAIRARPPIPAAAVAPEAPSSSSPAPEPAGDWQVQVGAFRNTFAAEAHLRALNAEVPELERLTATHQLRGGINRVRIGGIGDEAAARDLCERIAAAGRCCFVARPES